MRAVVLGAAAGGGFPQWNSNAEACRRARAGDAGAAPRTQASLAVSGDGERWFLINASPDLREQIQAQPILHPKRDLRSSPIEGVILTGADVDAIAGLLHLRERQAFTVYGQRARARRAEGQSDLRRAGRRLRAPTRRCRLASRSSRAMSTAAAAASRSSCSTCRARSRSTSRRAIRAAGTGGQAGRHGRRRIALGRTRLLYVPGCAANDRRLDAAAGRCLGRAVRRHAVARRRDGPRAVSAPRRDSAWAI